MSLAGEVEEKEKRKETKVDGWVIEGLARIVGRADRSGLPELAEQCVEQLETHGLAYYRVTDNRASLGRGMVVTAAGVIPDYPRVRRVFHLRNAISKYYYSPFYAEQLVPGYHARVTQLGDRVVAFRRDGICCPFTTDRCEELVPSRIFNEHPDLTVCLAIGGSGTPYMFEGIDTATDRGDEELKIWAIDLLERDVREPLGPEEKYELFDEYDLPSVPHVGPFTADGLGELDAWVEDLDGNRVASLVLKPSERHHRPLKYATTSQLLKPLPPWAGLDDDNGADPFFQRLLRAACAASELEKEPERWDWEAVGRAILQPLARAVHEVAEGQELRHEHSVWVHRREAAEELLEVLEARSSDRVDKLSLEPEGDGWRLRFARSFAHATDALNQRLSGASYLD